MQIEKSKKMHNKKLNHNDTIDDEIRPVVIKE